MRRGPLAEERRARAVRGTPRSEEMPRKTGAAPSFALLPPLSASPRVVEGREEEEEEGMVVSAEGSKNPFRILHARWNSAHRKHCSIRRNRRTSLH